MVAVSDRVALSLRALGTAGQAWLAGLPDLVAGLADDWSITVGAPLDGGRTAYVAEATTRGGTPVVLKVAIPAEPAGGPTPYDRELTALRLADGDPYVRLLRHDRPRRALLLERLGAPTAAPRLGDLVRTAARGWRPAPDDGRLPTGAQAARWHATFLESMWERLARPCSQAAVELAVGYARSREAAFDPARAVLVHGDVQASNVLRGADGLRVIDPIGLLSEPAHDLGVIQARGVPGRLSASDPRRLRAEFADGCERAGLLTGVDPQAIREWAYVELLSTGLHVLHLGDHREAQTLLSVADALAARPPTLWLMVGLPGAGKTTRAEELAVARHALRLTPDEWMIALFDGSQPDGKRDLLEGRLIALALQALRLGTSVVLDFGLWSRDERSALRSLAASAGASCEVVYLPVDEDVQRARIARRQATAPHTTFPMTVADLRRWRGQFEPPDAAELRGSVIPDPPAGRPGWHEWAAERWPSLAATPPPPT
ncbi:AAA family ATPase [Actinoplanes sp. URMC 104]|uniref:AAA family ATPase n=1 Tax=Actinoplanes sp. URMC 104 TaxID=3423409 RepID=UPI003F1A6A36